jgi:hypothetical protein
MRRWEIESLSFSEILNILDDPLVDDSVKSQLGDFIDFAYKESEESFVDDNFLTYAEKHDYDSESEKLINDNLGLLIREYKRWVRDDVYLILGEMSGLDFYGVLSPKRGNRIYSSVVREKVRAYNESLVPQVFFDYRDIHGIHSTPILKFTLTYDPSRITRFDAWKNLGPDLNRFCSRIKKNFGRIKQLRTFEGHDVENGYPHINLNILFEETTMPACYINGKWRYLHKKSIQDHAKSPIWPHGFMDVLAVSSVDAGKRRSGPDRSNLSLSHDIKYMMKDYTECNNNAKHLMQMAIMWRMRKRSYHMSPGFLENLNSINVNRLDLIGVINSNVDGVKIKGSWEYIAMITPYDPIYLKVKPPPGSLSFPIPAESVLSPGCLASMRK